MDNFVSGTIQKIIKKKDHYIILLQTKNDSIVYTSAYKEDLNEFYPKIKQLQVDQAISVKGVIYFVPTKKGNDLGMIIIKQIKFEAS